MIMEGGTSYIVGSTYSELHFDKTSQLEPKAYDGGFISAVQGDSSTFTSFISGAPTTRSGDFLYIMGVVSEELSRCTCSTERGTRVMRW